MRRCLVLANQTLAGVELVNAVRARVADDQYEFYVVVPATPVSEQAVSTRGSLGLATDHGFALAQQRLDLALEQIRALGAAADGEVGDPDPLAAARLALSRFRADEVVVSTLPLGLSRWLRGNLPARVGKEFGLPVTHVVDSATSGPAAVQPPSGE